MKAEKKYRGPCPCGSLKSYETCCQRWHGGETPGDAEALMRSRYTAYVLNIEDYLLATWHPRTRPPSLSLAESRRRWLGLVRAMPRTIGLRKSSERLACQVITRRK